MNKGNGVDAAYEADNAQPDVVAEGFHKLEEGLVKEKPPTIRWGKRYLSWGQQRKIDYLEKFAASMNHAAFLIQGERDQLLEICKKQEKHIESLAKGLDENNAMIQGQITSMNAERQSFNKSAAAMKATIRELRHGTLD